MIQAIGIDFGTTNSVVALLHADGSVTTQRYANGDVFRSVLCFWTEELPRAACSGTPPAPEAIDAYLEDPLDSRLIMSMKTYLAQQSFSETRIFGHPFTLERLVGWFLRDAARPTSRRPPRIIVGRPVRFAGEFADDALGADRLRGAYAEAGVPQVTLALEPEAAGTRFARTLTEPATVLIGDFGGGTSDFSVMRFEPGRARPASRRSAMPASASPATCSTTASSTARSRRCSARATATASWASRCRCRPSTTPASRAGIGCR